MSELVATTTTLIQTLPPAGHGLTTGVMNLLQQQADHSGTFASLARNLNAWVLTLVGSFGGLAAGWFFTAAARNIAVPAKDAGFWTKMRYDCVQWLAGFFDKSGNRVGNKPSDTKPSDTKVDP
jgi:hypothetical protein